MFQVLLYVLIVLVILYAGFVLFRAGLLRVAGVPLLQAIGLTILQDLKKLTGKV